jgi:hypothetical protein
MHKKMVGMAIYAMVFAMSAAAQNTFPASGNVGIGTTTPAGQLSNNTVNYGDLGNGLGGGAFNWQHTNDLGWNSISSLGGNGLVVSAVGTGGKVLQVSSGAYNSTSNQFANHLFTILGTGNVGIGTTSPAQKLEVNGNAQIDGALSVSGGGIVFPGGVQTVPYTGVAAALDSVLTQSNGNIGIGITAPAGKLSNNTMNYGDLGNGLGGNALNWQHSNDGGWNSISSLGGNGLVVSAAGTSGTVLQVSSGAYNSTSDQFANHLFTILGTGNVGIGTTTPGVPLEINGSVKLTAGSGASITFPDGTNQATAWNGVLSGGDYAESVDVQGDRNSYEAGDVLVINPEVEGGFVLSSQAYSTAVMGIYSTKPGARGRRQKTDLSHMKDEVPMAMVGIVPTKVSAENGPIRPGDLLVTSSRPGYAMKGTDRSQMLGAVIGKALGHLDSGTGVIEVGVTLQ